jgi:hypothetical protein
MRFYLLLLLSVICLSCATPYGDGQLKSKGRSNYLLQLAKPLTPQRVAAVYDHAIVKSYRIKSDCQPFCPKVDAWLYRLKLPDGQIIEDSKPISSKKKYWKNKHEARILAISLFGKAPIYLKGLLDFFESLRFIKKVNHISDPIWGYETFTFRVYVPKRNPDRLSMLGEMEAALPESYVKQLLDLGVEVVYVDNAQKSTKLDATFWRFLVTAEEMPAGERIRYLVRDADWKLTAGEAFSVGEWIDSNISFHRMNLNGACIAPVTASLWGGVHVGKETLFADIHDFIEAYPYRLEYGDDELFIRDIIWPRMKYSGSVLTHYDLSGWKTWLGNPFVGSCEQATQKYCDAIKAGGVCEDRLLPDNVIYPAVALGMRATLDELKQYPYYFDMHLNSERGKRVRKALSVDHK